MARENLTRHHVKELKDLPSLPRVSDACGIDLRRDAGGLTNDARELRHSLPLFLKVDGEVEVDDRGSCGLSGSALG